MVPNDAAHLDLAWNLARLPSLIAPAPLHKDIQAAERLGQKILGAGVGGYSGGRSGSDSVMQQPRLLEGLGALGSLACGGASVMVMRPPWASATRRARVRPRP